MWLVDALIGYIICLYIRTQYIMLKKNPIKIQYGLHLRFLWGIPLYFGWRFPFPSYVLLLISSCSSPKTLGRIDLQVYAATGVRLSNLFTRKMMIHHSVLFKWTCGQHKLKHTKTTLDYIRDGKGCIQHINQCIQNKQEWWQKAHEFKHLLWLVVDSQALLLPNFLQLQFNMFFVSGPLSNTISLYPAQQNRLALFKDLRFPVKLRQRQPSGLGAPGWDGGLLGKSSMGDDT